MEITSKMLEAAIRQAVKEGLLAKYASIDDISKNADKIKRVLSAAIEGEV